MTQIQNRFGILKLEFGICLGFRILNLGFPPEHSEVRRDGQSVNIPTLEYIIQKGDGV